MATVEIEVDMDGLIDEVKVAMEEETTRIVENAVEEASIDMLADEAVSYAVDGADVDQLVSDAVLEYDFDAVVTEGFAGSALGKVVEKFEKEIVLLKDKVAKLEQWRGGKRA